MYRETSDDAQLEEALVKRQLFTEAEESENLTSETSDEVFSNDELETPKLNTKLTRSNAFRRGKRRISPKSTPRVTRSMTRMEGSVSMPSSPSQVIPNQRQSLGKVLQQLVPVVPETVQLGPQVQLFHRVLEDQAVQETRGYNLRETIRHDYKKMNKSGKRQ